MTLSMKALLYARYGQYPKEIEELIRAAGLEILPPAPSSPSFPSPDVVVTFGGDGTILGAERDYPGIPKLPLRDSKNCHICSTLPNEEIVRLLVKNKLPIREYAKLEVICSQKHGLALNDVTIRNKLLNVALRFTVTVNDEEPTPELIGDGVVIATPFGSTAYSYSITHAIFNQGFGMAFNNIHNAALPERVVPEDAVIKVAITRGPADLGLDNDPEIPALSDGDVIAVKKAAQTAKILTP